MAFYVSVLLYEYAVLYALGVGLFWTVVLCGSEADISGIIMGIFYAQGLLMCMICCAIIGRFIYAFLNPIATNGNVRMFGGLGDFLLPYDGRFFVGPPDRAQKRPKYIQQVSRVLCIPTDIGL